MIEDTIHFTLTNCHARLIAKAFSLTLTEAKIIEALYKARSIPMSAKDLDDAVPPNNSRLRDSEFRSDTKSINALMWRIRQKQPGLVKSKMGRAPESVESSRPSRAYQGGDPGYWLDQTERDKIKKLLENADEAK